MSHGFGAAGLSVLQHPVEPSPVGFPAVVTRRSVLGLGLAGAAALAIGTVGDRILDRSAGTVLPQFPHDRPGPSVSGSFYSHERHRTVGWTISYPPGHEPGDALPTCIVLHGFDSDHRYAFTTLKLQIAQAQLVDGRPLPPIALASIDGGNSYWHPRRDGDNPIGMILGEFLPMLSSRGLRVASIGALGWSMGGYGVLLLAELSSVVTAVAAESPAIWPSYADAERVNSGAFDSEENWERYSLMADASALRRSVVRVDCGLSDPFLPASRALEKVLRAPSSVTLSPGSHDATFWAGRAPEQLRFITEHLS